MLVAHWLSGPLFAWGTDTVRHFCLQNRTLNSCQRHARTLLDSSSALKILATTTRTSGKHFTMKRKAWRQKESKSKNKTVDLICVMYRINSRSKQEVPKWGNGSAVRQRYHHSGLRLVVYSLIAWCLQLCFPIKRPYEDFVCEGSPVESPDETNSDSDMNNMSINLLQATKTCVIWLFCHG